MSIAEITPKDTRYIPFTQQAECCVPTSLLMIMYRHGIPLLPAEELGYHLGLVVSPAETHLFYNPRVSDTRPAAGYGTRTGLPQFEANKVFRKLGIPLRLRREPFASFESPESLKIRLAEIEAADHDALFCADSGILADDPKRDWGHICVFDHLNDQGIQIVDASPHTPKWRTIPVEKVYAALQKHASRTTSAGVWVVTKI